MKIYLFGSTGMLGNYVRIVLSEKFEVKCITRDDFDILNDFTTNDKDKIFYLNAEKYYKI